MEHRRRGRFGGRGQFAAWRRLVARLCVASLVTAAALSFVPAAHARILQTVLQDDGLSLFAPRWLPQYMSRLRWLGIDQLRISAEWKLEALDPNSPTRPQGVRFSDPRAYDSPGMTLLDDAVRAAAQAGLNVIIDPAFSAPLWATTDRASGAGSGDRLYRTNIDVHQLVAWEVMLARRYSGYFTPAGSRTPLPRVGTFTLWNEPNGVLFLEPQWRGDVPASADWYRELVELAYPAIKRVSPYATVLIGNTSDTGSDTPTAGEGVSPLAFIRRLACVDTQLRPVYDGSCARFQTVPADGYAHHPYERNAPPWVPSNSGHPGWAQMGDLPKLQALLDELVVMRRLAPGATKLWLTEQGYESNAELRDRPWSESRQAQMNAASEYLAWRDPRVASFAQFLLRDTLTYETLALRGRTGDPPEQLSGTWTTGLMREDMSPKPALAMFRSPIVVRALSPSATAGALELFEVWGRARPVRSPTEVRIQIADAGGAVAGRAIYRTVGQASTDQNGIFDTEVASPARPPPEVRFQWLATDGTWQNSPPTEPLPIPGTS